MRSTRLAVALLALVAVGCAKPSLRKWVGVTYKNNSTLVPKTMGM
jgi:hypothetical protein